MKRYSEKKEIFLETKISLICQFSEGCGDKDFHRNSTNAKNIILELVKK